MSDFYDARQRAYRNRYHGDAHQSLAWTNGFQEIPKETYRHFLTFINRGGNILDLGCGNGLLLRFLCEESQHTLIPFGVDFLPESIAQARQEILPSFAENFVCKNIRDVPLIEGSFEFILMDPYHLDEPDRTSACKRLRVALSATGALLLYSYADSMQALGLTSITDFFGLARLVPTKEVHYPDIITIACCSQHSLDRL